MDKELTIAMIIGISTFYLLFLSYMLYRKQSRLNEKMKIKKDTIDFCFNDKVNYEEIIYSEKLLSFNRKDAPDEKILMVLSLFDKISIALKHNVYDESIIIDYYGKYFIHFYAQCRYFILQRREATKNPDLFIEYEMLIRRWERNSFGLEGGLNYVR